MINNTFGRTALILGVVGLFAATGSKLEYNRKKNCEEAIASRKCSKLETFVDAKIISEQYLTKTNAYQAAVSFKNGQNIVLSCYGSDSKILDDLIKPGDDITLKLVSWPGCEDCEIPQNHIAMNNLVRVNNLYLQWPN
jgi:hypothetical protein